MVKIYKKIRKKRKIKFKKGEVIEKNESGSNSKDTHKRNAKVVNVSGDSNKGT